MKRKIVNILITSLITLLVFSACELPDSTETLPDDSIETLAITEFKFLSVGDYSLEVIGTIDEASGTIYAKLPGTAAVSGLSSITKSETMA